MPIVSIILPTYKGVQNLELLIPRISQVMARANLSAEIIVVDDDSSDGTLDGCCKLFQENGVRLNVRATECGLSDAVLSGMNLAQGEILVVLDPDLSHPPEKIPDLVRALDDPQIDFAIGSRNIAGGSTSDRGVFRWLNSQFAILLAWPLTTCKDPLASFFALRRQAYVNAADRLDPNGYKIGLELLVKCPCRKIVEIPIAFQARLHGQGKLTRPDRLNYLRHLHRLYNYRFGIWASLVQFILVGATGMVINLTCLSLLLNVFRLSIAAGLAIWIAMTWNFFFNRRITFSTARRDVWWKQYFGFCAGCSIGAAVNWTTTLMLNHFTDFFSNHVLLAAGVGVISGTVFNFTICKFLVFRKTSDSTVVPSPAAPD